MKNILGATWHKTQTLLERRRTTKLKFLRKLREGSQKGYQRSSAEQKTEQNILGALARLDDFLMNPLLPGHSGTTLEPSRNALNTSQGTNEDVTQNDPHPKAGVFHGRMTQISGPEEGHDSYGKRRRSKK